MKFFLIKYKYILFLIFVFFVAELIVWPVGNFPLNDDWSYAYVIKVFQKTGEMNIGTWPAMSLATHVLWGSLFTKFFGYSFFVLRISTIISATIGAVFMNRLILKITNNELLALLACLVIHFNPIYFNLVNTYMTDVNFNVLIVICVYFAYNFFQTKRTIDFIMIFVFALLLALLRQFGVIIPICFAFSCFFLKEKKWFWLLMAIVGTVIIFAGLKIYENYLFRILHKDAAYKFSKDVHILNVDFWKNAYENLMIRYKTTLLAIFIYSSPIAILYLGSLIKEFNRKKIYLVCICVATLVVLVFYNESFLFSNIFTDMALGPEVFYQSVHNHKHAKWESLSAILIPLKYIFSTITVGVLSLFLLKTIKERKVRYYLKPEIIFLITLFFAYTFMLVITESYFDRYHLPLITILIILISFANRVYRINHKPGIFLLLLFMYTAIAGTRDYFRLNENKWKAYYYLKNDLKINYSKINAGFEISLWRDGEIQVWVDVGSLEGYDYLIQFRQEPGFKLLKEYEFQRWFPFKRDKINIFVREQKSKL